jgi:outer membrane protein assembly factor BamB
MNFKHLSEVKATEDYLALMLIGLGALLAIASFASIVLATVKSNSRVANTVALLIMAIFGSGLAGFGTYFRTYRQVPPHQRFRASSPFKPQAPVTPPADEPNRTELAALKSAILTPKSEQQVEGWNQWRGPRRDGIAAPQALRDQLDHLSRSVLWKAPIKGGFSSFAAANGFLYTMDLASPREERVLCLDASTGKELWHYTYPEQGFNTYSGPRATPAVVQGLLYTVGAGGTLLCLPAIAAGQPRPLWQHQLMAEFKADLPEWGIACSPLVERDLVIVQPGGKKGSVAAFDRLTGKLVWSALDDPNGYSSPVAATVAAERQIICFTGRGAVGLRPSDGAKLWYYPWRTQFDQNIATPIVAGDYVFLSSGYSHGCALLHIERDGSKMKVIAAYVKSNRLMRNRHNTSVCMDAYLYGIDSESGVLRCIDLRTGDVKWESPDRANGCPILADGRLIIQREDGTIDVVEATPRAYKQTAQVKHLLNKGATPCWVLPALDHGRLFLRDPSQIVCLDVKKGKA